MISTYLYISSVHRLNEMMKLISDINLKEVKKLEKAKMIVSTIALVLVLTFAALPIVSAHDPPWEVPTYAYLSVAPNPVGVDQTVFVVFWLDKIPPSAAGAGGDRWRDFTVEVTTPSGSKETLGPYTSDPTGSGYDTYTPNEVGTYTFKFNFPGQVASLTGPTGISGSQSPYIGDTYLASSATTTLTVQEDPIPSPPTYPLPTEYWTRPIEGQNTAWYKIASNWLSGSHIVGKVQPDGIAPNSPHIMWTKPIADGGVVGGSRTGGDGKTYYDGTAYESPFGSPIIMHGRLYYELPLSSNPMGGGYICVDLLTGEEIWWKDFPTLPGFFGVSSTSPSFGQLYDYESGNQHGVIRNGYLWSVSGTTWNAYDPLTGEWLFNLTNVPSGTEVYGPNGEILRYVLNSPNKFLALWNNTAAPGLLGGTSGTMAWLWRPVGKTVDASTAYSWKVSIPWLPDGASILTVIHDDLLLGMNGTFPSFESSNPYTMWAIDLNPDSRGEMLWMKTYDAPAENITRGVGPQWMGALLDPDVRVFLKYDKETIQWSGYSLDNGSLLWGPTPSEHDLNYYSDVGLTRYAVAYGKLYSTSYSGILYCYDLTNGSLLWTYNYPTGLASPWPNWPLGIGSIADEKVYLFTTEHSANAPHWVGVKMYCVDAFTGEEIWTVDGYGSQGAMAIADGYLIYLNLYDMQIYCVGKGPSATTVTIQDNVLAKGDTVLITGTVIDESPGTKQNEQAARFPNGVPAIADEYQDEWMGYLYMQKPMPQNVEGVNVTLIIRDPHGDYYSATVTTDSNGMFSHMWTPGVVGEYHVTALFEGSESYYSSQATTAFGVDEAPESYPDVPSAEEIAQTTVNQLPEIPAYLTIDLVILILVAIGVVIGLIAYMALRKIK